ncbi:MAG: sigma-54 dependent transcriptional regulator [Rhodoferax sp.]
MPNTSPTTSAEPLEPGLSILIIEDEPDVARTLSRVIASCGTHTVETLLDPQHLPACLRHNAHDLIFTDLMMPAHDGFAVIAQVKAHDPDLPVVVLSGYATLENAVAAVKLGAFDFLAKPFSPEGVEVILTRVVRNRALRRRVLQAQQQLAQQDPTLRALLGKSVSMVRLREWIIKARSASANVLIEGESGTGKELVARALHADQGPFVALNMAALPEHLAESELFGYRKGAFTGATSDHPGLIRQADGGTLFLDEVNSASPALQAKLLRVLGERRVRPLGATQDQPVEIRLICASNVALEPLVEQGQFRRDLFHRIKVLHVRTPTLRERPEDIPMLVQHILQRCTRNHHSPVQRLAPHILLELQRHTWPGNVRELENTLEQAVILANPNQTELQSLDGLDHSAHNPEQDVAADSLAWAEMQHIRRILAHTGGNKAQAARILQIDYKTLLRKLATES